MFDNTRSDLVQITTTRSACICSLGGVVDRVIESIWPYASTKLLLRKFAFEITWTCLGEGGARYTLPLLRTCLTTINICGALDNISDVYVKYFSLHHINIHIISMQTYLLPKCNKCNYKIELYWWFLTNTLFTPQPFVNIAFCFVTILIICILTVSVSAIGSLLVFCLLDKHKQTNAFCFPCSNNKHALFTLFHSRIAICDHKRETTKQGIGDVAAATVCYFFLFDFIWVLFFFVVNNA